MTPQDPLEPDYLRIEAELCCGAGIVVRQRARGMVIEFEVTPKPGTRIEDTARIIDGKLRISMDVKSVIGLFQLMSMIVLGGQPRKKKLLGLF